MCKKIFIGLLYSLLLGCKTAPPPGIYTWLQSKLSENHVPVEKSFLVLFISERMCVACISQEIININQSNVSKPILIVGVFERNRYFQSAVNAISEDKFTALFINTKEYLPERLPLQPFYGVFDYQTQTITEIFNPQPCDPITTMLYLKDIDRKLTGN
jgi:hypothetical protein